MCGGGGRGEEGRAHGRTPPQRARPTASVMPSPRPASARCEFARVTGRDVRNTCTDHMVHQHPWCVIGYLASEG